MLLLFHLDHYIIYCNIIDKKKINQNLKKRTLSSKKINRV